MRFKCWRNKMKGITLNLSPSMASYIVDLLDNSLIGQPIDRMESIQIVELINDIHKQLGTVLEE